MNDGFIFEYSSGPPGLLGGEEEATVSVKLARPTKAVRPLLTVLQIPLVSE